MKNMGNMGNMMKQAQKLQAKMMKLQEELSEQNVEATAGGGMVKVVANGKQQSCPSHRKGSGGPGGC